MNIFARPIESSYCNQCSQKFEEPRTDKSTSKWCHLFLSVRKTIKESRQGRSNQMNSTAMWTIKPLCCSAKRNSAPGNGSLSPTDLFHIGVSPPLIYTQSYLEINIDFWLKSQRNRRLLWLWLLLLPALRVIVAFSIYNKHKQSLILLY